VVLVLGALVHLMGEAVEVVEPKPASDPALLETLGQQPSEGSVFSANVHRLLLFSSVQWLAKPRHPICF
jgi:hypothetical protein